jgi:hypothetical protein
MAAIMEYKGEANGGADQVTRLEAGESVARQRKDARLKRYHLPNMNHECFFPQA